MTDTIRIGGRDYEFPEEGYGGADVLEDCEEEINLLFEIPDRPRNLPLGKHARAIRTLTYRVLAPRYPDLTLDDTKKMGLRLLLEAMPLVMRALGFMEQENPSGEGSGPPVSTSAS